MKQQLTCPHCGHFPAMSPWDKVYLFYHQEPKCPNCGTVLSNPFWFDILRTYGGLGLSLWVVFRIHDWWGVGYRLLIVIYLVVFNLLYYIGGLVSLYLIPLRQHWKTT